MEFALALLKLWRLKYWVAAGAVVAILAAFAVLNLAKSTVYAAAETTMLVDSPNSALGNTQADLTPFVTRAGVFARLMTSAEALDYIGQTAHIPGNMIAAVGPEEIGSPQATHVASAIKDGKLTAPTVTYDLRYDQNPLLPTVDVYAEAPTSSQAIALANGAVVGFTAYIDKLENSGDVPASKRVTIRQLGEATGGEVDSGASKVIAVVVFVIVLLMWCFGLLVVSKIRRNIQAAKAKAGTSGTGRAPRLSGSGTYWAGEETAAPMTNGSPAEGTLADAVSRSQFLER
jgi:hypothetical protein